MMKISSSISQLKVKEKALIKKGRNFDLFDDVVWFSDGKKIIKWEFSDFFTTVGDFLNSLGIEFRDFTSKGNFEMDFKSFLNSQYKQRVLDNEEVHLFDDKLMFDWRDKVCFYSFPIDELEQIENFLKDNNIKTTKYF